ncbi:hypothetical protein Tco_1333617, partial [Tanacetum coccineum]
CSLNQSDDFELVEEGVLSWLDEVSLVDRVFDGAFGGVGDEEVVVGEGVVRFEEDEEEKKSGKDDLFN